MIDSERVGDEQRGERLLIRNEGLHEVTSSLPPHFIEHILNSASDSISSSYAQMFVSLVPQKCQTVCATAPASADTEICEGHGVWAASIRQNGDEHRSVQAGEKAGSCVSHDADEADGEAAV
jgi:hypothetical protein